MAAADEPQARSSHGRPDGQVPDERDPDLVWEDDPEFCEADAISFPGQGEAASSKARKFKGAEVQRREEKERLLRDHAFELGVDVNAFEQALPNAFEQAGYENAFEPGSENAFELASVGDLARFDARPEFAEFVFERAGIGVGEVEWPVGDCVLRVRRRVDGRLMHVLDVLAGWPSSPVPWSLCLAEVYRVAVTGVLQARRPRDPELARFKRRALIEAGLVRPAPVRLPGLPEDAPASARATWRIIAGLLRVRWLTDPPEEPLPLSVPFLLRWAGDAAVTEGDLTAGKKWLEGHGFIEHVADGPVRYGKRTKLWLVSEESRR